MDKLIYKKLSGESLTRREHETLTDWINASPENKKVFFQLRIAFMNNNPNKIGKMKDKLWEDLNPVQHQGTTRFLFLKWAASILVVLFLGVSVYLMTDKKYTQTNTSNEVKYFEKVCVKGQKLTITLPDGSKVKLNAGSKLSSPEKYVDERVVEITGEAFFEVTKSELPFIVKVGDVNVKVLGTSFNVDAYTSNQVIVAVASGKVSVTANTSDFKIDKDLVPGEQALYRAGEPMLEVSRFDTDEVLGWKDNLLVFKNSSFAEVTRDLNNWYDVTFIIDDQISLNEKFNGGFVNPTLEEVMESLAHLYSFKYEIDGKQISISNMN